MDNWTKDKMVSSLRREASNIGLDIDMGTEDGLTWVTLWGAEATPGNFDRIGAMVADSTGRDFYARSASVGSMNGALDVDEAKDKDAEPFHYLKRHIERYGTKFEPAPECRKYRRVEPTAQEEALTMEFSGSCDAAAQARVEALLGKNPDLSAARLESVVWEVQGPRGPEQRSAPLWWATLAGSDPEGWSAWMDVADSEISAEALTQKAGELGESEKRLKALAKFGVKPRGRSFGRSAS